MFGGKGDSVVLGRDHIASWDATEQVLYMAACPQREVGTSRKTHSISQRGAFESESNKMIMLASSLTTQKRAMLW